MCLNRACGHELWHFSCGLCRDYCDCCCQVEDCGRGINCPDCDSCTDHCACSTVSDERYDDEDERITGSGVESKPIASRIQMDEGPRTDRVKNQPCREQDDNTTSRYQKSYLQELNAQHTILTKVKKVYREVRKEYKTIRQYQPTAETGSKGWLFKRGVDKYWVTRVSALPTLNFLINGTASISTDSDEDSNLAIEAFTNMLFSQRVWIPGGYRPFVGCEGETSAGVDVSKPAEIADDLGYIVIKPSAPVLALGNIVTSYYRIRGKNHAIKTLWLEEGGRPIELSAGEIIIVRRTESQVTDKRCWRQKYQVVGRARRRHETGL